MNEHENLKEGQLIILKSREAMIDLLYQSCVNGLNCLCLLDSLTKEYLVQKLLLMHACVNLDNNLTIEDYKYLVKAMHDICKWGLYIDKFQTLAKTNNKIKKLEPDYVFIEFEENKIVNKHWMTLAEKRQVVIVLTSNNNETFNDDGAHKLVKPSQKVEAKIIIDFIDRNVKIDILLPKNESQTEDNNTEIQGIKKQKSYRILNKNFKITSNFKSIIIDNQTYDIPDYFNVDMVKNEDEKTWEMIFYQMFADEINAELTKRSKDCI